MHGAEDACAGGDAHRNNLPASSTDPHPPEVDQCRDGRRVPVGDGECLLGGGALGARVEQRVHPGVVAALPVAHVALHDLGLVAPGAQSDHAKARFPG